MTKVAVKPFNTKVESLKNDGYLFTFINVIFISILQYNEDLKLVAGETSIIKVVMLVNRQVRHYGVGNFL